MIKSSSAHIGARRLGRGINSQPINPFNPLQSYLIQNQTNKEYVNSIANKKISYFLDKTLSKNDLLYRKMLRNQLATGVMSDDEYKKYFEKVASTREQSEIDVASMRIEQIKTEEMIKSAKNLRPKNAIKHVKMTQEEFAVNNCAQITDEEELKKQIQQIVHVNKIKNFVQRVKNKKQIKYLNKALTEIKESHEKKIKPIKYLINENKDPRALVKPLRMPITDFKVVQIKQKPLDLSDDLSINFFDFNVAPHQIVVPKKTAEQEKIKEGEIITDLGFKIRQTSEISVVTHQKNIFPPRLSESSDLMTISRRKRNMAREQGILVDNESLEAQAKQSLSPNNPSRMSQHKTEEDNMFVTSFNPYSNQKTPESKAVRLSLRPVTVSRHLQKVTETFEGDLPIQKSIAQQLSSSQLKESRVSTQKDLSLMIQQRGQFSNHSQQSSILQISPGKMKGTGKMSMLMESLNDYAANNNTRQISEKIDRIQNDYSKLSSQYNKDFQQQQQLESLLKQEKSSPPQKDIKAFLR